MTGAPFVPRRRLFEGLVTGRECGLLVYPDPGEDGGVSASSSPMASGSLGEKLFLETRLADWELLG
jgi:hypothetical protein